MIFSLIYSKKAHKHLEELSPREGLRMLEGCERLMTHPFPDGKHVKKLKGYSNLYRLRVGDFRVVFRLFGKQVEVLDVISKPDFQKFY